ncbi:MAG: hypothetical protein CMN32_07445 [Saprospirales bacterium]|nr:hypothetical protein [Saprospirales bacterium]
MNFENKIATTASHSTQTLKDLLQWVVVHLFDAPTDKKNEAVKSALDNISKTMGVDRCHFALVHPEQQHLVWLGEGVTDNQKTNRAPYGSFDPDSYTWLLDHLSQNEYLYLENIETDLPGDANKPKDLLLEFGYASSFFVALKKGNVLLGWIGFGKEKGNIDWQPKDLETIQAICSYLYTAVTRFLSFKALKIQAGILQEAERMAQMGSWEFDLRTKRLRTSEQFDEIFGLESKLPAHSLKQVLRNLGASNWQQLKGHFEALYRSGSEIETTHQLIIDGEPRFFRVLSKLKISKKGAPYKLSGIVQEVTRQKLMDEELENTRIKQSLIFKNIRDYITLYRVEGPGKYIIDSFNDTAFELQKYFVADIKKEDILNRDLKDYLLNKVGLPEVHVVEKLKVMDELVSTRQQTSHDEEVQRPDGSWIHLKSSLTPIVEGGQVTYLLWSAHDITQLQETQKKLLEKDREYRLALRASKLGFYKWNMAEDFLYLDEAYSEMLGLGSKPNVVSTSFMENRLVEGNYTHLRSLLENSMASQESTSFFESEAEYETPEGIKRVYSSALFMRTKDYPAGLLLGFARDITDQKLAEERLKESEARWRTLHDAASDAIVIVENDVFVDINRAALDVFGCLDKSEIIGKTPWSFSPEMQPDGSLSREKGLAYIRRAIEGERLKFSWIHCRADGTPFEAEVSLSAIHFQGRLLVQGIVRDVTEKMQMIRAIRESEEKYRSLVEYSLQGILIMVDGKVRYFNNAYVELLGYSKDEIYKMDRQSMLALVHPQDMEELERFKEYDLTQPILLEFRFRRKDGNFRWVRCRVGRMPLTDHNSIVVTAIDITEQKKAHELALISATESEDRERQRIAAELHDGLGQLLSSSVLNLGAMKASVKQLDEKARRNYKTALETIKTALDETRMISHNLMPKTIKDFGYSLAVEQLINSLNEASDVQLSFFTNFREGRLSPILERNLYRITQEAVTNIVKHSKAQSGVVQLMKYPEMLILTIEDDGTGFDPAAVDSKNHIGLRNIAIRSETIGARLDIDSRPGNGTIIALQIPLIHE